MGMGVLLRCSTPHRQRADWRYKNAQTSQRDTAAGSGYPAGEKGGAMNDIVAKTEEQFSDQQLQAIAAEKIGRINLLVAGNTGVGKSTLVNAVFGADIAPTSDEKPETMLITKYEVPGKPLNLFDTRGFEAGSTEAVEMIGAKLDELAAEGSAASRIHIAWLCINTHSSRIEPAHRDFLTAMSERDIPSIVVLTKASGGSLLAAATKLAQPSAAIVEVVAAGDVRGIDKLVLETYRLAPEALKTAFAAAQQTDLALKRKEAFHIIHRYAALAVGTGPLPLADIPAVWLLQRKMRADIDQIFGIDHDHPATAILRNESVSGIVSTLGSLVRSLVLRRLPLALAKFSGVGTVAAMAAAGLSSGVATEALGRTYVQAILRFFETGKPLIPELAIEPLVKIVQAAASLAKASA